LLENGHERDKQLFLIIDTSAAFFSIILFIYLFLIVYTFIHMCIHLLGPACFQAEPSLQFCWRESIRDNKKDITLLLAWDKDSYTERFLALLPCTCVLQPTLVHLCQTSSLLPGPLPIVVSVSLRLFAPLQWAHQPHTSFRFPFLSLFLLFVFPFSGWPLSNNITVFVLGL
jgi:hypothetical protein